MVSKLTQFSTHVTLNKIWQLPRMPSQLPPWANCPDQILVILDASGVRYGPCISRQRKVSSSLNSSCYDCCLFLSLAIPLVSHCSPSCRRHTFLSFRFSWLYLLSRNIRSLSFLYLLCYAPAANWRKSRSPWTSGKRYAPIFFGPVSISVSSICSGSRCPCGAPWTVSVASTRPWLELGLFYIHNSQISALLCHDS